jgi:DNA mismatch endonuclease, patch repair protein
MTDAKTSARMSRVRQRKTDAELTVGRILHHLGHRFRYDNPDLPGSPDLANRTKHWAVYVQGCFWHSHEGCSRATVPRRNRAFWLEKFRVNKIRDARVQREMRKAGYLVLIVWECELLARSLAVTRRLERRLRKAGGR